MTEKAPKPKLGHTALFVWTESAVARRKQTFVQFGSMTIFLLQFCLHVLSWHIYLNCLNIPWGGASFLFVSWQTSTWIEASKEKIKAHYTLWRVCASLTSKLGLEAFHSIKCSILSLLTNWYSEELPPSETPATCPCCPISRPPFHLLIKRGRP